MNRKLGRLREEGVMDVSMQEAASSPLRAELWKECGTCGGGRRMALGGFPGMRTWALAGREEGVKQGPGRRAAAGFASLSPGLVRD